MIEGKIPSGKVPFLWQLSGVRERMGLDMVAFANHLQANEINGLLVKFVEGRIKYNHKDMALLESFFNEMARVGIEVHGWSYNYGNTNVERTEFGQAQREAELSAEVVNQWPILSWSLNAEKEWKGPDGDPVPFEKQAQELINEYRSQLNIPLGLSSYKFPKYHNYPWKIFLSGVDFYMPQVYWQGVNGPDAGVDALAKSLDQWYEFAPEIKPTIPAGTIYKESNWPSPGLTWWPTEEQVENFMQAVYNLDKNVFKGVSAWEIIQAVPRPELWDAFCSFKWDLSEPQPEPDPDPQPEPQPEPIDLSGINQKLDDITGIVKDLEKNLASAYLDIMEAISGSIPEPDPDPEPEPQPEPIPVGTSMVQTSLNFGRIFLSWETGKNKAGVPIMQFYPIDSSKTAERIFLVPGSSLLVESDVYKMDGGRKFFKVIKDQPFKYGVKSRKVSEAGAKDLYIEIKFLA